MSAPPSAPAPRLMARSIVSFVMLAARALSTAARRRGLPLGSGTPPRVAMVISRISLVNTLARLASSAFLRPSMDGPLPMCISWRYRMDRGAILHERCIEAAFAQEKGGLAGDIGGNEHACVAGL